VTRRVVPAVLAATAAALLLPTTSAAGSRTKAIVDHVADGDTIKVVLGQREEYVRFIGIDTPEVYDTPECGGAQASAAMKRMLKPGDRVTLVRDRTQGNRDDYDRLLRYVEFNSRDLGLKQAKKGWADVFVFDQPFKRLDAYDRAADRAQEANRGAWRLCGGFPGG
jgi:micrococcal nuclease